jgi:hypothetical protein
MFVARFLIGVGEAAYGSVGVAVILSVFPAHLRSTLAGLVPRGRRVRLGPRHGHRRRGGRAARLALVVLRDGGLRLRVLALFALAVTEKRVDPSARRAARRPASRSLPQAPARDSSPRAR